MKRFVTAILFAAFFLALSPELPARAACFSPAGNAGDVIYYGGYQSDMYCDGGAWVSMGGPIGDTSTGLVGWWKFDETSGASAADSTGNGNTGTLFNAPTWTPGGMNAGALTFVAASSQYVTVPDTASLRLGAGGGSWTVATWVNLTTVPGAGLVYSLVNKDNPAAGDSDYQLLVNNGVFGAGLGWTVLFDQGGGHHYTNLAVTMNAGTWYYLAGVWDGTAKNLYLYVNGALVGTQNFPGINPDANSGNPLVIGSQNNGGNNWTNGTLDDVRVYSRALTATDVMTLYTSTGPWSGDITTGLIHYWKLDEAAGVTTGIADAAAAETGTMTGAGATFTAGGRINNGFSQPGGLTSDISVGSLANVTGLSHFTESFWYKRAAANAYLAAGQEDASPYPNGISIEVGNASANASVTFTVADSSTADFGRVNDANDTNWHMATLVFDGTQASNATRLVAYIDGAPQTLAFSGTIPAATTPNARPWYLGDVNISEGNQGNGTLDEIRLYNRSLSVSDVLTLYNSTATLCAGPTGYTGDLVYNSAAHVYQFCNGSNWIPAGPVPGAGGGGCTSPAGGEGDMLYNADNHVTQFCDGANWVATGGIIPIPGLVGWWNFDEGSGTAAADSSGNGNTGTLTNGPVWTTSGKIHGALTFTAASSQYVSVPYAAPLEPTTAFTVAAWVNPTSSTAMGIISSPDNDGFTAGYRIDTDASPEIVVNVVTGSGRKSAFNAYHPPAGQWTHVALVYDGSFLTAYANGIAGTPVSAPGPVVYGPNHFLPIGHCSGCIYFNGTIDDVRIYNRALSASELWRLYNGAP